MMEAGISNITARGPRPAVAARNPLVYLWLVSMMLVICPV